MKIQERSRESENEGRMMEWLQGRLPVPQVLAYKTMEDREWKLDYWAALFKATAREELKVRGDL